MSILRRSFDISQRTFSGRDRLPLRCSEYLNYTSSAAASVSRCTLVTSTSPCLWGGGEPSEPVGSLRARSPIAGGCAPEGFDIARFELLRQPQRCLHARLQLSAPSGVRPAPGSKRQVKKRLLCFGKYGGLSLLIEPAVRLRAVRFDLPCQLVADRPRRLDLAPHARRDLQLRGEGLFEAFRRCAAGQLSLCVLLEQRQRVAPSGEGDVRHGCRHDATGSTPFSQGVDAWVKTLYSPPPLPDPGFVFDSEASS